jgi:hypothetical protein
VVRKQNRLGVLKVSATWHCDTHVLFGTVAENTNQVENLSLDDIGGIEQVHANEGRDLVVTRATGAHLAAKLWASDFDKATLECTVHVFVRRLW